MAPNMDKTQRMMLERLLTRPDLKDDAIASIVKCDPRTVKDRRNHFNETGSAYKGRPKRYNRKLRQEHTEFLSQLLVEKPGIYLEEIRELLLKKYDVDVSTATLSRHFKKNQIRTQTSEHRELASTGRRGPRPAPSGAPRRPKVSTTSTTTTPGAVANSSTTTIAHRMMEYAKGLAIAFEEAQLGYQEGGIPIGAALIARDGTVLGRGHNMRVQNGNPILHGETSALQNAGRLPATAYKGATMYTTLSPCDMCTGACLLYGISRVVIGENKTFLGGEAYLKQRGAEVVVLDNIECRNLMDRFITEKPHIWIEDIGEEQRVFSKETTQASLTDI